MSTHSELLELAEVYAMGGLDAEERARLAEHVADGCAECEAVLRANANLADELLLAVPPVQPSPDVRARLMDRVRSEAASELTALSVRGRAPRRGGGWGGSFAAAAGVLIAVGLTALTGVLGTRLAREQAARQDLEDALEYQETISWSMLREMEDERSERVSLEQRLNSMSRVVAAIEGPLVRTLALAGQGPFEKAVAKAYIDPQSGRLILYASNLPPVPDGKTYQLWVIVENTPVSAGLFRSDSQGEAKYDSGHLDGLDSSAKVAVTLEPAGGMPRPSGPIVLAQN
jgi:anti-sigma-K factor RskA